MVTERSGQFRLISTIARKYSDIIEQISSHNIGNTLGEATIITSVKDFELTADQTEKIKAIHDHAVAEIGTVLGWQGDSKQNS